MVNHHNSQQIFEFHVILWQWWLFLCYIRTQNLRLFLLPKHRYFSRHLQFLLQWHPLECRHGSICWVRFFGWAWPPFNKGNNFMLKKKWFTSWFAEATTTAVGYCLVISSAKEGPDKTQKVIVSPNVFLTISETNFFFDTIMPKIYLIFWNGKEIITFGTRAEWHLRIKKLSVFLNHIRNHLNRQTTKNQSGILHSFF